MVISLNYGWLAWSDPHRRAMPGAQIKRDTSGSVPHALNNNINQLVWSDTAVY